MVFQIIIVPLHRQKQKNDYEQSQDYLCLDMAKALRLLALVQDIVSGMSVVHQDGNRLGKLYCRLYPLFRCCRY